MRRVILFCFLILILMVTSCNSPYSKPEKTINRFYTAQKTGDQEIWLDCFTRETRELLKKYYALPNVPASDKKLKKQEHLDWQILNVEQSGDKALVGVKLLYRNGKYWNLNIKLKKEDGDWKIDRTDDIRKMIELKTEENIIEGVLD